MTGHVRLESGVLLDLIPVARDVTHLYAVVHNLC